MHYITIVLLTSLLTMPVAEAADTNKFGRMFPQLPAFVSPTPEELTDLSLCMQDPNAVEQNNDGITAGFTYLGQFIDHDLTLDTEPQPTDSVDPTKLVNRRTFFFDLDSVFGGGPTKSPQLYEVDSPRMLIQEFTDVDGKPVRDVPRNANGSAIISDGRNDENQIIAQIQVAFIKFYNRLVDDGFTHSAARRTTTEYYQWVVLHGFLPHLVGRRRVSAALIQQALGRNYIKALPSAPVEFSVAAYRFGHSMVRNAYRMNTAAFPVFNPSAEDLHGGRPILAVKLIDWGNFFTALAGPGNVVNISRQIDPLLTASLFNLPIPGAAPQGSNNLAFRNMLRAKFYGLPSGQDVAKTLRLPELSAKSLNPTGLPMHHPLCPVPTAAPAFAASLDKGTPLWFYILAESRAVKDGAQLGPVGAHIVVDVFLRQLRNSTPSIIKSHFIPRPPIAPALGRFEMSDFLTFAGVAD